eukprot:gene17702-biopygen17909
MPRTQCVYVAASHGASSTETQNISNSDSDRWMSPSFTCRFCRCQRTASILRASVIPVMLSKCGPPDVERFDAAASVAMGSIATALACAEVGCVVLCRLPLLLSPA